MKRTKAEKNEPTEMEKGILEAIDLVRRDGVAVTAETISTEVVGPFSWVRAAIKRLEKRGLIRISDGGSIVKVDRDEERKKKRAKMTVALAEKHGGVLFEDDVWCFLGTDGADKFAEAVRLEGLEVKRWRDDMAEKAQIVYA